VVVVVLLVERQRVLEPGAAAAANPDAQAHSVARALAAHELPDLGRGNLGEDDHASIVSVIPSVL
jgi:hypothetical protein